MDMAKKSQLGKTGRIGEEMAKKYLLGHHYDVVAENVTYKFGEIDIVATKAGTYHFIEVKSADVNSHLMITLAERLGKQKLHRLKKSIQQYVADHDLYDLELQIDLMMVKINHQEKTVKVKLIDNVY